MFWGYLDDSGDDDLTGLMTLSCFIGHWSHLFSFEAAWGRVLDAKNRQLIADGRPTISRFHATHWSTKRQEFEGWSDDEKFDFFDKLLGIFLGTPASDADKMSTRRIWKQFFPKRLSKIGSRICATFYS